MQLNMNFLLLATLSVLPVLRAHQHQQLGGSYTIGSTEYSIYWEDLTALPVAVSDATASTVGDLVYLIGGCDSPQGNVQQGQYASCGDIADHVLIYNPASNSWTQGSVMPQARFRHAAAVVGTDIYIIGGRDVQDSIVQTVVKYSTTANSWTTVQSTFAEATSDNAAFAHDGMVYTCGGYSVDYSVATTSCFVMDTSVANPTMSAFQRQLNVGRGDFSMIALDGFAYAYGGFNSTFAALASMERLRLGESSATWTMSAAMQHPRGDFAATAFHHRLLAIGGEDETNSMSAGESLRHVEAFSPLDLGGDGNWLGPAQNLPIPHATFRFCGASVGNSVYIFGGQRAFDSTCSCYPTTSDVFSYTEITTPVADSSTRITTLAVFAIVGSYFIL
jgi:hypothetical protein